jgi:hypothetical protein
MWHGEVKSSLPPPPAIYIAGESKWCMKMAACDPCHGSCPVHQFECRMLFVTRAARHLDATNWAQTHVAVGLLDARRFGS